MNIGNIECYGIIYKITNTINGKIYIGQTTKKRGFKGRYHYAGNGIERVYKSYEYSINKANLHLMNSIKKYGFDAFEVIEIFDMAFSKNELDLKEINYIRMFKCTDSMFGYNSTFGGANGKPTEDVKRRIGDSNRGSKNGMYGNGHLVSGTRNHWFGKRGIEHCKYGKTASEETRKTISEKTKNSWNNNKKFREENLKHLEDLGKSQMGLNNPASMKVYLYDENKILIGEYCNKDLYTILKTYPRKLREYRDSGKLLKNHYIFTYKL